MKALILVKFTSLETRSGYQRLKSLPAVIESFMVYGRYDVVVTIHAETLAEIRRIILSDIQSIPGVIETLPCLIVEKDGVDFEPGLSPLNTSG